MSIDISQNIFPGIENICKAVETQLGADSKLARMFRNCYTNTIKTTVRPQADGTTFVITGDIPAMWLRDSAAQLRPYMAAVREDTSLARILEGLVKRQFMYINIDGYANAFNESPDGACWSRDDTEQSPWVWERKYEIDSLCYPVELAWMLWKATGNAGLFDDVFFMGLEKLLDIFETEQYHEERSTYRFQRENTYFQDTLSRDGRGALVKSGTGMIWSGFRPSDDACVYGYLIPSNMFASVILGYIGEITDWAVSAARGGENGSHITEDASVDGAAGISGNVSADETGSVAESGSFNKSRLEWLDQLERLGRRAWHLKQEIEQGIETYGITKKEGFGEIYAYEVDGYGQYNLMDDANVPSLLSMSYLGYKGRNPQVAENTRSFILSAANPFYFSGRAAAGIGSLHTPAGYIWPIALAMEGLTSTDWERKREILDMLMSTDAGTGLMHEGFHADDPEKYTRPWFSWANAMFCQLVLDYCGFL